MSVPTLRNPLDALADRSPWPVLLVAVLAVVVNLGLIATFDAPSYASTPRQYQSYYWAAASANAFDNGHPPLTALSGGAPVRFEDITKDDLGYPLVLSTLVRLGIIDFTDEARATLSDRHPGTEESRAFMFDDLRVQTEKLNRGLPMILGFVALALAWSTLIPTTARLLVRAWGLTVFAACQILPHASPAVVVRTLHSHGLVFSAWILGMTAFVGLLAACATVTASQREASVRRLYYLAGLAAGLSFGFVETIRRSTGQVLMLMTWSVLFLVVISRVRAQPAEKRAQRWSSVLPVVALGVLVLVGMFIFDQFISFILDYRDARAEFARPRIEFIGHPIYFTLLVAIAVQPNSLGVTSEADVVALVTSTAPGEPAQDSEAFIEQARRIFFDYASDHPGELIGVAWKNLQQNVGHGFTDLGISFSRNLDFVPVFIVALMVAGLLGSTWRLLRSSGKPFAESLSAQLTLGSAVALAGACGVASLTTQPARFDVASAVVLGGCALVAAVLAVRLDGTGAGDRDVRPAGAPSAPG